MPTWTEKPSSYKAGTVLIDFGFIFFAIGFGSPTWTIARKFITTYTGLWQICVKDLKAEHCHSVPWGVGAWLQVVRVLETICCIGFVISFLAILAENFTISSNNVPKKWRRSVITSITSGIFGIVGAIVFGAKSFSPLSWGFGLTVTGCFVVFIGAIVVQVSFSQLSRTRRTPIVMYCVPSNSQPSHSQLQNLGYTPSRYLQAAYPAMPSNTQVLSDPPPPYSSVVQNCYPQEDRRYNIYAQSISADIVSIESLGTDFSVDISPKPGHGNEPSAPTLYY